MALIDNKHISLKSLLQENVFEIPKYQRGYSWSKNELEDFWSDLEQLYKNKDLQSHFLGLIVVHSDTDDSSTEKKYIIDGQQRITTSVILLDSIRTAFNKIYDEFADEDANHYSDQITNVIGHISNRERINNPHLILGENDREFFKNFIQSSQKKTYKKNKLTKSQKKIYEAKTFFEERVNEFLDNFEEVEQQVDSLKEMEENLLTKFKNMYIEANEEGEAFIIFETLNARGKALETSDLLKNHVFRQGSKKIDTIQNKWTQMLDSLGNIDATTFIRHYWNSRNKFTRTQGLYKIIKTTISTTKHAEDLVENLCELASVYSAIREPDINSYFDDKQLNMKLRDLKLLKASTYYPILLALYYEEYTEKDILKVLTAIETVIVRNIVVADENPNTFETKFAEIAYNITHHDLDNTESIISELQLITLNDKEFEERFANLTVKQDQEKRYLLRAIDSFENKETQIIKDNNIVHIEHIMPQKPSKWNVDPEQAEEYKNRLGNLTLLGEEYNKNASNDTFEKKKEVYKKSKIEMNKELVNLEKWTFDDIENRQKNLAKLAVKIWTI
ncbi:DUF262 domain-containing protein [Mammaliicoccus sciuri]|uniref:DUF262 domain-containing protein n=1 Tax=Mammaliicoccus sciuri TaxID=1296 RepID=UPI001432915E|nr:DUF262 domain-containing protein [Mammaliicoccus sciuri]MBF0720377.1 DUF262 domain-containing protein [Mammaliicoccus sciuri]MBG9211362.1 DUF262 domain-containing protein [Mammaliicoccus sciuri]MCJ1760321.1 DUF262 domain-containing HNH endonuclease family protein [Mammaliicoccus sciuri]MDT0746019.1 DUF262 domain-containing HNH endonuclease family protein [Mammaliicoccus sciuri]MDT0753448.1 DUF262 domain-containing HNH endonuclease family protein [Mammaliicoccus sciuri]